MTYARTTGRRGAGRAVWRDERTSGQAGRPASTRRAADDGDSDGAAVAVAMGCVILIGIAVFAPTFVGTFVVASGDLDWGWALVGGLMASLLLTNWLAGSVLSDVERNLLLAEIADDQFKFLGKWVGAMSTVCSPWLTIGALVGGVCGGLALAKQQSPGQ